jgi:hypothetical protein
VKRVLIILIFLSLSSCQSHEKKIDCLEKLATDLTSDDLYNYTMSTMRDSLISWADQGIHTTKQFNDNTYEWKIDLLFFNSKKDKLFGWLLQKDINKSGNNLDYIHYFAGEKRNGKWYYYIHNMPSTFFAQKDNNERPYDFDYLSNYAKNRVIEGGLIKRLKCELNATTYKNNA